jgi:putative SOS response-associated peptidase YedK
MCGRYTNATTWAQVHAFSQPLDLSVPDEDPVPRYNIAPTDSGWVIVAAGVGGEARQMRWGLVPSWARDVRVGASMINARLETAAGKPAFRAAWKSRRCLVPASGYFEWCVEQGVKQPYWIHPADGPVMMFAGLWEHWRAPDGSWIGSYAILTRDAPEPMRALHDRAPLVLRAGLLVDWLQAGAEAAAALALAAEPPPLAWHAVGRAVGNVRNQGPQLIEPLPARGGG